MVVLRQHFYSDTVYGFGLWTKEFQAGKWERETWRGSWLKCSYHQSELLNKPLHTHSYIPFIKRKLLGTFWER